MNRTDRWRRAAGEHSSIASESGWGVNEQGLLNVMRIASGSHKEQQGVVESRE